MKTQVCIIGGGPAGLFLSHVLAQSGIDSVIIEKQSKEYVLGRIRAGVLEQSTVDLLRMHGLAHRMDRDAKVKDGTWIAWQDKPDFLINTAKWTGNKMTAWGQTQITEDLYAAREADGAAMVFQAEKVTLSDVTGSPELRYEKNGKLHHIQCDFVAGCDGSHGVSKSAIPSDQRRELERIYPYAWLGIMVERPPLPDLMYACHKDGFALASQRNPMLSRYYVQVPRDAKVEDWSDDRFWEALLTRFPERHSSKIQTGPSIEKSITPLRSYVFEPMRWGKLFLAGDAAHLVPPTGAKGLNLAFSDIFYLSRAFIRYYKEHNDHYLETYSEMALRRVWAAENISYRLTMLLHETPGELPFDRKIRENQYDLLLSSEEIQRALAFEYAGLPFES